MAVHRWVMGATKLPIDLEDAEGVKKMRALKCTIDADEGLKNVQQLFIKVFEIQKTYRLKTDESEIIKWLSNGIKPTQVKYTVLNALQVKEKKGRARRKRLTTFHRSLKGLVKKFYEAKAMGMVMGTKPSTKPTTESRTGKGKDEDGGSNKDNKNRKPKGPKRELKCYHCGGKHKVAECSTCPADRKSWKPSQWWAEQKSKEKAAKAAGTT